MMAGSCGGGAADRSILGLSSRLSEAGSVFRAALEGDALGEAQIEDEGAQVRPERRAFRHVLRRRRLEFPGATRAGSAQKRNARHMGNDRRDFDMVIGLADELRRIQKESAAALAGAGEHIPLRRRIGMKRAVRPACGLRRFPSDVLLSSPAALCPWLGGMLEFSGVFGGRLSLARSSALSARSASTSLLKRSIASACESLRRISASLSSESSFSRSIPSLNQLEISLSNFPRIAKSGPIPTLTRMRR